MARLAARRLRRPAREPPSAAEDLGSGAHAHPDRHARRLSATRRARARRPARARDGGLRSLDAGRVRAFGAVAALLLLGPLLGACTREAPEPEPEATEVPEELAGAGQPIASEGGIGTPMDERVAVLGLLNRSEERRVGKECGYRGTP